MRPSSNRTDIYDEFGQIIGPQYGCSLAGQTSQRCIYEIDRSIFKRRYYGQGILVKFLRLVAVAADSGAATTRY